MFCYFVPQCTRLLVFGSKYIGAALAVLALFFFFMKLRANSVDRTKHRLWLVAFYTDNDVTVWACVLTHTFVLTHTYTRKGSAEIDSSSESKLIVTYLSITILVT